MFVLIYNLFGAVGFLFYSFVVISSSLFLIYVVSPKYGHTNILVYLFICAMMGSLTVMACKGLGIAVKLTLSGKNQLGYPFTWFLLVCLIVCIAVQMNYLNKSLDIFKHCSSLANILCHVYYLHHCCSRYSVQRVGQPKQQFCHHRTLRIYYYCFRRLPAIHYKAS